MEGRALDVQQDNAKSYAEQRKRVGGILSVQSVSGMLFLKLLPIGELQLYSASTNSTWIFLYTPFCVILYAGPAGIYNHWVSYFKEKIVEGV